MSAIRIDELIREFDRIDDAYKREEVEEALTLRAEITPRLLRILEEVADDPVRWALEERNAHIYAAVLLAHFQEPTALLPIIRAFRIPEDQRDELWSDMVTETLPALLLRTCNGDFAAIRELICDRNAPVFVRNAAVEALTFAVVYDLAEREEVISFLSGLFTGTEAEAGDYFWSGVVCSLDDLHPGEAMAPIRQAFADGLVDTQVVDLPFIERDLIRDRDEMLSQLRATAERRVPADVHDYLSWFAGFREHDYNSVPLPSSGIDCARRQQEKKKTKNRVRNKHAKKARKKNRR